MSMDFIQAINEAKKEAFKQAVKEFAEKLKKTKNTICIGDKIFIDVVAVKAIDKLFTELYGDCE